MSGLVYGFAARMSKQAANAQGETDLSFEVLDRKRPKPFGSNEEA